MLSKDKKYKYRTSPYALVDWGIIGGRVISIDVRGRAIKHKEDGTCPANYAYDLVEVGPYDDLKDGEPAIFWNSGEVSRGYFAGINNEGLPLMYFVGRTKWSSEGATQSFAHCRRPTPEELES